MAKRNTKSAIDPASAPEFTPLDVSLEICPLNQQGLPDMYRHVPKRFVPVAEATARGFSMAYDGRTCRYGHQSAFWVSNENRCVECERKKKGLPPIYPTSKAQTFYAEPRTPRKDATTPIVIQAPSIKQPEPDRNDKAFLTALAELRDFNAAAIAAGSTRALIESRISCNKLFADAVSDMCDRNMIQRPPPRRKKFEWDDEKRELLVTTYIDTGELESARAAVGCSPSQFYAEVDSNHAFRTALDEAAPRAARVLEDVGIRLSKAGNDKLLTATLKAKLPNEYGDRIKLDIHNATDKMTDEQLAARLLGTLKTLFALAPQAFQGETINATYTEVPQIAGSTDAPGTDSAATCDGNEVSADEADVESGPDDNSDLL